MMTSGIKSHVHFPGTSTGRLAKVEAIAGRCIGGGESHGVAEVGNRWEVGTFGTFIGPRCRAEISLEKNMKSICSNEFLEMS